MDAGDNLQGVSGNPVSWEHFFHCLMLYHENLRRDIPNPDATQYRHPPLRGITQRELEGLTSFLELLATVITWVRHACGMDGSWPECDRSDGFGVSPE